MNKIHFYSQYLLLSIGHIIDSIFSYKETCLQQEDYVVFWNGPSLQDSVEKNFNFIKDKKKIVVNNFFRSKYFFQMKPELYIIADGAYWVKNSVNLLQDGSSAQLNKKRLNLIQDEFLDCMSNQVKWPITLYLPLQSRIDWVIQSRIKKNHNINIEYYSLTPISTGIASLDYFLYDLGVGMPCAQTVLIAAIFIPIFLWVKNIFVFWADHSWHEDLFVDKNNLLYTKDKHFYDQKMNLIPILADGINPSKIHKEFLSLYKAFKGHILLEGYAKHRNVKVYNASEISYIDAYERRDIYNS